MRREIDFSMDVIFKRHFLDSYHSNNPLQIDKQNNVLY